MNRLNNWIRTSENQSEFQKFVDILIENAIQKIQSEYEKLIKEGVEKHFIVIIIRNGDVGDGEDYYATLGVWYYSLEEAIKFLKTYKNVKLVNLGSKTIMDCHSIDGRIFNKMENLLKGTFKDEENLWKKHKKRIKSLMKI